MNNSYSLANKFMATVNEKGEIFSVDVSSGNQQCIGVTAAEYQKMKEAALFGEGQLEVLFKEKTELEKERDKYFNMLVEAGILQKPKSQEEINKELMKENAEIKEQLNELLTLLKQNQGGVKDDRQKDT